MSFIKNTKNSQSCLLKTKSLAPLLAKYNEYLLQNKVNSNKYYSTDDVITGESSDYLIPNNNKKFYLLITKKSNEKSNDNSKLLYNTLYFFPDELSIREYENNNVIKNTISNFYLETDYIFKDEYLLEGYLYKNNLKYEYLLTDILLKNKEVVDVSYDLRYVLLNEMVMSITNELLKELNNHITINIHPIFSSSNKNLIKIFKNNFIYKKELLCIERISNLIKTRYIGSNTGDSIDSNSDEKIIRMTLYTDVYNVFNKNTKNKEGILYVKGIKESKQLKLLFKEKDISKDYIIITCKYNSTFAKWQPINF